MTTISEIMTRDVYSCRLGDTLAQAAKLMWDHDCGCIPVVDSEGRPVAMLTDRDICMATLMAGEGPSEIKVEHAMSKALFTCAPGDSIEEAEQIMRDNQVRRLPVVEDGKLVGILAMNDLVRAAAAARWCKLVRVEDVEATLAGISQPRAAAA